MRGGIHVKRARRALTLVLLTPACVFADEVRTNGTMDLPAPTGVFLVGRESFHWIDRSRRENGSENKSDHRELMVHISYPAERTSRESVAPYFPNLELVKGKIGTAEYSILHSVHTHTLSGGKLSAARSQYPIVILSHGNQMN